MTMTKKERRNLAIAKLEKLMYYMRDKPVNGKDLADETIEKVDFMLDQTIRQMMDMDEVFGLGKRPVESLNDKMAKAWKYAFKVAYIDEAQNLRDITEKEAETVFRILDFGYEYAKNIIDGRCSLQATLDFDPAFFERSVENDIRYLGQMMMGYGIKY